jgi:hypothetical protein
VCNALWLAVQLVGCHLWDTFRKLDATESQKREHQRFQFDSSLYGLSVSWTLWTLGKCEARCPRVDQLQAGRKLIEGKCPR